MSAALVQKALEVVDPDFNKYSKGGENKRWKCVNCRCNNFREKAEKCRKRISFDARKPKNHEEYYEKGPQRY
jgi:hypothetical protein